MTDEPPPEARRRERRRSDGSAAVPSARRSPTALLAVLLAPACAACDVPLDQPTRGAVCRRCWDAIVPFTPPLCRRAAIRCRPGASLSVADGACARAAAAAASALAAARAIGAYDGSLRAIVHALKYERRPIAGAAAGARCMREARRGAAGGRRPRRAGAAAPRRAHGRAASTRRRSSARHLGAADGRRAARVRGDAVADGPAGGAAARERARTPSRCAARRGVSTGCDDRAGRRCEHDRRDAGGVRARAAGGGRARGPRAYGSASRVSTALNDVGRDLVLGALAVEPQPAGRRRLAPVALADARQQRRSRSYRSRAGRLAPQPRSRARCRAGWSGPAPAGTAGSRAATRHRGPALRRRRCSTRGSDRR